MHANYLLVYYRSYRQTVEAVREGLPELYVVSSLAFLVEPVYTVDGRTFVVASEQEEILRELYLVGK